MTLERTIAKHLLDIEAVALRPNDYFTWTSGIKSPIYCDNRITMSYPKIRREIAVGMSKVIKEKFPEVEVVAGTATAGIPHAAWVSEVLDLPMIYVRDSAKKHGKTNQIEGRLLEGQRVVIIEDLISTGLSSLKVDNHIEYFITVILIIAVFYMPLLYTKAQEVLENRFLLFLGFISYSFYLLQEPILLFFVGKMEGVLPLFSIPLLLFVFITFLSYGVTKIEEQIRHFIIKRSV